MTNSSNATFAFAESGRWRESVEAALRGAPFESLVTTTAEGLRIEPLYEPPAQGSRIIGSRSAQAWAVAQRIDHIDADAANCQARSDLENGAQALTIVFNDAPSARGFGLRADSDTLKRVLDAIELQHVTIRFDAGAAAAPLAAAFIAWVIQRNLDPTQINVDFGIDPIGTFAATGTDISEVARREAADVAASAHRLGLGGSRFLADGRCYHQAGAGEAQELGFTLATAIEYMRQSEAGGMSLDVAREHLAFLLTADADEFLTLAKFRAFRLLWAQIEALCGLSPKPARLHAETSFRMMTRRDPWVNVMRSTVAVFAAGVAGADVVTNLPFTAALGLPDEAARRLARNAQLILIEEANVAKVIDPASGSGAFEALTKALCAKAWTEFQKIEKAGSMTAALRAGQIQQDIERVRERRQRAIALRSQPITGSSDFPDLHEAAVAVLQSSPQNRAPATANASLLLPSQRDAEPFEQLREASDAHAARFGRRPTVFLACLGPAAASTSRASFAKNLFEAGGVELSRGAENASITAVMTGFENSGAALACLCSSDRLYADLGVAAAAGLKAAGAKHVYLVGNPKQLETALRDAGVGTFLQAGCDALTILRTAYAILGLQEFP
jgi:methylmalonyl-CoA mutase